MSESIVCAKIAVEYWKLLKAFERAIARLPQEHLTRTSAQLRFSTTRLKTLLSERGLNLVTFEGQRYEPSLSATALNAEDFAEEDHLIVQATIEPAVVEDMKVLLLGKVMLMKGD